MNKFQLQEGRFSLIVFWGILLLSCLDQPVILTRFGHDVVVFFDYIYRVHYGLRPGLDMWAIYGSFPFWIMGEVAEYNGYSTGLFLYFSLAILFAWLPFYWKLKNVEKWQFAILLTMLFGIYHLGDIHAITYANFYNRTCLFLLLGIFVYAPFGKNSRLVDAYSGISLFLLLNIKLSYFFPAVLFLLLFRGRQILYWASCFMTIELLYFLFVDNSLFQYLEINRIVSRLYLPVIYQKINLYLSNKSFVNSELSSAPFLGFSFSTFSSLFLISVSPIILMAYRHRSAALRVLFSNVILLTIQFANYLPSNDPLVIFNACVFMHYAVSEEVKSQKKVYSIFAVIFCLSVISNFCYSHYLNYSSRAQKFQDFSEFSKLREFKIIRADGNFNEDYSKVNKNALSLATACNKSRKACDSILVVSFEDFVTRELNLVPVKNQLVPIQFGANFDSEFHPQARKIFDGVNYVLIRAHDDPESTEPFKKIYQDELRKFIQCDSNEDWQLLCRK